MNVIGAGLVLGAFLASLAYVLLRGPGAGAGDRAIVRVAHYIQDDGMRKAIDEAMRAYERLHPGVTLEQVVVPERIYNSWVRTVIAGSDVADLLVIDNIPRRDVALNFVSLTAAMEAPNPYNAGTDLATVRWRDTFVDGLYREPAHVPWIGHYYGIPLSAFTIRLVYNRELLREITGRDELPHDYAQFVALCDQVRTYAREHGRVLFPIAGSADNLDLLNSLFSGLTQSLGLRLNPTNRLWFLGEEVGLGYLDGSWNYRDEEIQLALRLVSEVGGNMQPGFFQQTLQDALFLFLQQRSLMMAVDSVRAGSIIGQARFPTGVMALPLPDKDDPSFGKYLLGRPSEALTMSQVVLGIPRGSRHRAIAADFLHFLSSQEVHARFVRTSGKMPTVSGVAAREDLRDFAPYLDGYPIGFFPGYSSPIMNDLWRSSLHLLFHEGGVERFVLEMESNFLDAIYREAAYKWRNQADVFMPQDSVVLALWKQQRDLTRAGPAQAEAVRALDAAIQALTESQEVLQGDGYWLQNRVQTYRSQPSAPP